MEVKKLLVGIFSGLLTLVVPFQLWASVAYIGTVDFDYNDSNDYTGAAATDNHLNNSLQQSIVGASFSLSYNMYTWDYPGYDEPGFAIYVDGVSVFSKSAGEVSPNEDEILDSTGWQVFSYTFETAGEHVVTLYAGNTGDSEYQTWVYIDDAVPFVNGSFETGDFSGWETEGQVGVVSAVPVPAAAWLLGAGLMGLVGLGKRRHS